MVYFCLAVVVICLILMFVAKIKQYLPQDEEFVRKNGTPIKEKEWSYEPMTRRLTIKGRVIPFKEIKFCTEYGHIMFVNGEKCYLYATFRPKIEERKCLGKDFEAECQKNDNGNKANQSSGELDYQWVREWDYSDQTHCLYIGGTAITMEELKSCDYGISAYLNDEKVARVECRNGKKYKLSTDTKAKREKARHLETRLSATRIVYDIYDPDEMTLEIIEFAKKSGVNLYGVYEERDKYLNKAVRGLSISSMPTYQPTYTRGVVSGSLGDSISVLTNAQKKKDYEEMVEWKKESRSEGTGAKWKYNTKAKEIIAKLKDIPNSEKYVEYEEEQLSYNMSILNKV